MKKKIKSYRLFIIIPVLFLMTIGFASIVISSNFNGEMMLNRHEYGAHYENVYDTFNNTKYVNLYSLSNDGKTITVTPTFNDVGDEYYVYAELVNDSDVAIEITNVKITKEDSVSAIIAASIHNNSTGSDLKTGEKIQPHSRVALAFYTRLYLYSTLDETYLNKGEISTTVTYEIEFKNVNQSYINDYYLGVHQPTEYMNSRALLFDSTSRNEYSGMYLYAPTENDEHPIFFYRGNNKVLNHAYFAGHCWKIIRTTSNGNVKLLYNGDLDANGYCLYHDYHVTIPGFSMQILSNTNTDEDTYYQNIDGVNKVNTWYENNLSSYSDYIVDEPFCETPMPKEGFSKEDINLECTNGHQFSVATGELTYPIAAVDIMELVFAGFSNTYISTYQADYSEYYWFNSNCEYYILGSYTYSNRRVPLEYYRYDSIDLLRYSRDSSAYRPVIHVTDDIFNYGSGSIYDPYRIEQGGF
jgi:hypothetical protein